MNWTHVWEITLGILIAEIWTLCSVILVTAFVKNLEVKK